MGTIKKSFFSKMFANGETDTISSKRVIAFFSFIMLSILGLLSAFGFSPLTEFIYVFGTLAGAQSVLTTIEKIGKGHSSDE